jgi:hypothetical protein
MLIYAVLEWTKWGLSSKNAAFPISDLEWVGLHSYNLVVHVFDMFPQEGVDAILTKEVDLLTSTRPNQDIANLVLWYRTDICSVVIWEMRIG